MTIAEYTHLEDYVSEVSEWYQSEGMEWMDQSCRPSLCEVVKP